MAGVLEYADAHGDAAAIREACRRAYDEVDAALGGPMARKTEGE